MSVYYKGKRSRNIFVPGTTEPFRISRSKIDLFMSCPRCFYLDRRLGIERPPSFPFNLNSAVDTLLKNEFDIYRKKGAPHPLMIQAGVQAIPYRHELLDEWRDALRRGITFLHPLSNFLVTGGIDDVWVNDKGQLIIVDYKSTSKKEEVTLDADWQVSYKRQMEVYQWLFKMNGFQVSSTGYFVYCNGLADKDVFNNRLEFNVKLIPYKGDDSWVEPTLMDIKKCLDSKNIPAGHEDCDYCRYCQLVNEALADS